MELNNQKISTSIQYQLTNVKMFKEIFENWKNYYSILLQGPNVMKMHLLQEWNDLKENLKNDERIFLKDLNKNVTINDFDITLHKTENGTNIFFFTFPDYEYRDAASKYVALALTKNMPRYFTLEYSEKIMTHELCWHIGEFLITPEGQKRHNNYGSIDNNQLSSFIGYVLGLLETENN